MPGEVAMPGCLAKLTLTEQQQDQVKGIVREYDADLAMVWKQFGERYMETIRTEALLLAAIEDNLTEPQRKQVRDQRRKTAQHQKALAGTDVKPNQATAKPASAVEDEIAIVGISLTPEQEEAADKLQEKYLGHLRSLNRDIQGLHTRLVSLEADKLVELENILTKEQLVQLHEFRQSAPVPAKVATRPDFADQERVGTPFALCESGPPSGRPDRTGPSIPNTTRSQGRMNDQHYLPQSTS